MQDIYDLRDRLILVGAGPTGLQNGTENTWLNVQTFYQANVRGLYLDMDNPLIVADGIDPTTELSNAQISRVQISLTVSDVVMTATPTFAHDQVDGTLLVLVNDATTSTKNFTVQDQGTLPGSAVKLSTATAVLKPGDTLTLVSVSSVFHEIARSIA